ncbi:MAG TPA: hypothetical protein VJ180_03290 [Pyrinomonadaceae bacterium]|nr:hypothetical protein [Pyrinomonadaceae bacterium]
MSRIFRQQDAWPASSYARFLWLAFGLWEDIFALVDTYKSSTQPESRLVIARHVLVDFDSLDELLKEFHDHIKKEELTKLQPDDQNRMNTAFSSYHRAIQPHRDLLKNIRNNLGSHRTGMPWVKAPQSGITTPNEWGRWEHFLISLENECDLAKWSGVFRAAYDLLIVLQDFNLAAWYRISEDGKFVSSMPVLPPGYYPIEAPSEV